MGMSKIIMAMETLELKDDGDRPLATGMATCVGKEFVLFSEPLKLDGKVEAYLNKVVDKMMACLNECTGKSLKRFKEQEKSEWLRVDPSQITLLVQMMDWVAAVEDSFNKNNTKEAYERSKQSLYDFIILVQGDLSRPLRTKIMCMITMETHNRDITQKLVDQK